MALLVSCSLPLSLLRVSSQSDLTPKSIGEWSFDENGGKADLNLSHWNLTEPGSAMASWIKRMFDVKKDVVLLGSPWSPPQWMKQMNKLRDEFADSWVDYMVKYLLAYKARGIVVDAMTMQNEPLHSAEHAKATPCT